MKKLVFVLSYLVPIAVVIALAFKDPGTLFVLYFLLAVFGVMMLLPGRKKAISDVPLFSLYATKDKQLFFKVSDKDCVPVEVRDIGDPVTGFDQNIFKIGNEKKFDPKEIVTVKTTFKSLNHPDLRLDSIYR